MSVGVLDLKPEGAEKVTADIKGAGGRAITLLADISKRTDVTEAVEKLRQAFGPALILVSNAGIVDFRPFEEVTDDLWDRIYAVNVKGPYMLKQAMLPDMKAAKWGRIIYISSSGVQTGGPTVVPYSSSKAALWGMTRGLALEFGSYGITVNNIPPGGIAGTEMFNANATKFPIPVDKLSQSTPVGRLGKPEDIANAVSWLASEDSSYITGQTIGVNGGRYFT